MALVSCPECKAEVSDRAAACPKCGFPLGGASKPSSLPPPVPTTTRASNAPVAVPASTYTPKQLSRARVQLFGAVGLGIALGWFISHMAEAALVGLFGSKEANEKFNDCLTDAECSDRLMAFIPVSGVGKVVFALVVVAFVALGLWSRNRYLAKVARQSK